MRRLFLGLVIFFMAPYAAAMAAPCTAPAGPEGQIVYSSVNKKFHYCNGTGWVEMINRVGPGTGGCDLSPHGTRPEGVIVYNEDDKVLQGCSGDQWQAMGPLGGIGAWKQVSGGVSHSCAIKTDGSLWCWGAGSVGELGNGVTGDQESPVRESSNANDWASVSAGHSNSCAVKTDGSLWCWGQDTNGQLGNGGVTGDQVSPVRESTNATNWLNVSTGSQHSCAVKTDGSLWCWGRDDGGQLGNGAAGNQTSPMRESTNANDWASVSTGGSNSCGVKTDGSLWCWGYGSAGQIGNGATGNQVSPARESSSANDWVSVSTGSWHSCGMKTDGSLWCWGQDGYGQVGNGGPTVDQLSPVQESSGANDWVSIDAGSGHNCAVKTDGSLWCWGNDASGQLGNGPVTANQVSPVRESSGTNDWMSVSAGVVHSCAVQTDGSLWCWGNDGSGQLGNGAVTGDQVSPVRESSNATNWANMDADEVHSCAVKTDGSLWCWGSDSYGQLGNGAPSATQESPVRESSNATNWANVAVGGWTLSKHSCAVKTDGSLWCWGSDSYGQLGNGAPAGNQVSPVRESSNATNWARVSAGANHSCAVKTDGSLWCWGRDFYGQLGNGAAGDQISPMRESSNANDWVSVSAGAEHSCGVKTDGSLWCWGYDGSGQLGNGAAGDQVSPMRESTNANDWVSVSAGGRHSCGVKSDGSIWCWGHDGSGQLGNGAVTGNQDSPVRESSNANDWVSVSAGVSASFGSGHSCGVKTDGSLWCWGADSEGQLGYGALTGTVPYENEYCGDPMREGGTIVYNSTSNAMQYCDGISWVRIGR